MGVAYNQRYDGEWVDVTEERFYACCDCGMVHKYEHAVLDGRILRRVFRDRRATADRRRTIEVKASIKTMGEQIMTLHGHTRIQKKRIKAKRKAKSSRRGSRKHG